MYIFLWLWIEQMCIVLGLSSFLYVHLFPCMSVWNSKLALNIGSLQDIVFVLGMRIQYV